MDYWTLSIVQDAIDWSGVIPEHDLGMLLGRIGLVQSSTSQQGTTLGTGGWQVVDEGGWKEWNLKLELEEGF